MNPSRPAKSRESDACPTGVELGPGITSPSSSPLLMGEQTTAALADRIEACIEDIKAGLCCPRVHGCEQNDGDYCLVRQAFQRVGLIPDPDAALIAVAGERSEPQSEGAE